MSPLGSVVRLASKVRTSPSRPATGPLMTAVGVVAGIARILPILRSTRAAGATRTPISPPMTPAPSALAPPDNSNRVASTPAGPIRTAVRSCPRTRLLSILPLSFTHLLRRHKRIPTARVVGRRGKRTMDNGTLQIYNTSCDGWVTVALQRLLVPGTPPILPYLLRKYRTSLRWRAQ